MKHFIQTDLFKFLPNLEKINFVETHLNKKTQKTDQKKIPEPKKEAKPIEQTS